MKPSTVSTVQVYWYDDRKGCRLPASWRVLYKSGEDWTEVTQPSGYGIRRDGYNRTDFKPVETEAVRLEVRLRPGFSAGIMKLKVNE